jgi:hypothetical protein
VVSLGVLETVLLTEALLLAAALAGLFGHAAREALREHRHAARLARARRAVRDAVQGRAPATDDRAALDALPRRLQVRVFLELAPQITGGGRLRLARLADALMLRERAEARTRSIRWWRRVHAVRFLHATGGGETVVPGLLEDRHPAVRAAAVEWSADHANPDLVRRLVALLPRPDRFGGFVLRDTLIRIGPGAVPALAAYLERQNGEATVAALDVAAALPDPRYAPAARRLAGDPDALVRRRACAVLAALGGEAAVEVLRARLDDPDAGVRAASAAALGRLGHWASAPALARLLRDPAWPVRSGAAHALRALGSPGLLYLRRALADPDRFAADIARQVLETPTGRRREVAG